MQRTILVIDQYNPNGGSQRSEHTETTLVGSSTERIEQAVQITQRLSAERIERINDQIIEAADSVRSRADYATDYIPTMLERYVEAVKESPAEGYTLDIEDITREVRECFEAVEHDISSATAEHDEGTVNVKVVSY